MEGNIISYGSSIHCYGKIVESPGYQQKTEMHCEEIKEFTPCDSDKYPFNSKNRNSEDWDISRQFIHLRPRITKHSALIRLKSECTQFIHKYMKSKEFISITTPILTSTDCEGAGEAFSVKVTSNCYWYNNQLFIVSHHFAMLKISFLIAMFILLFPLNSI